MKLNRFFTVTLLATVVLAMSAASFAGVFISVNFGPPALPVYEQPPCPDAGYIWTPGYWAYGPYGYYWVPGTWVLAPQPGYLWTPGYWGWNSGLYYWHPGYWGPTVGYYGGIPYGYGYTGEGYHGGYWRDNHFYYNQSVNNVNVTRVTNVYNTTVINNNTTTVNRVSYNGGPGGIVAHPTPEQERYAVEKHMEPTSAQLQHENTAKSNPDLRASVNKGRPTIAATAKPAEFKGNGVVAARSAGAPYKAPASSARGNNGVPRPGNNVPRPGNNDGSRAASNAPRPENNASRPENEVHNANNVPRPGNNVPRPGNADNRGNASRPENSPESPSRAENGSRSSVPRPGSYQPTSSSRYESSPHPQNSERGQNAPRPGNEPRPESNAPRSQAGSGEAMPPRDGSTRPEPRPEGSRPEGRPEEPHETPHR